MIKRMKEKFPFYKQLDSLDCGPTCLRMIAKYYKKTYSISYLKELSFQNKEGVSLSSISDAAEHIGFKTLSVKLDINRLINDVPLPCIAHWNQNHFVVVYSTSEKHIFVADPAHGLIKYSNQEFMQGWNTNEDNEGVLLLLETTSLFFEKEDFQNSDRLKLSFLFNYLRPYKKNLLQLALGMIFGSFISLIFPFLTQSVVDFGIQNQNIEFVYTILIAQLMLFVGRISVDFIRSWILLHLGTRINISILSEFLIKLMKLPMEYFDKKLTGDLLQRIQDHKRIEAFLTSSSLNMIFSIINLIIFTLVIAFYSSTILIVFLLGTFLHSLWIIVFMKKRRELDFKRFHQMSENQSALIQLITGMQDIKLFGAERQKRWEWERIQAKLFKVNIYGLSLNQYQQAGSLFINELKNIIITFISAKEVINGDMTLGMLLAVSYIIGQLNNPVSQMISFIHAAQDAKISLERLGEVHHLDEEEVNNAAKFQYLPNEANIKIENVSFQYNGPKSEYVLQDINLVIENKKITAIVGESGSGKTTLLKLLLKYYKPTHGEIKLEDISLDNFDANYWRSQCGIVMQEGYIFNDSIAKNITIGDESIDFQKMINAAELANIRSFIESLPLAYNTKIGNEGHGLSQGQKQRILIARSVYKDPNFFFLDEATSSLDTRNEYEIMQKLNHYYKEKKTVLVIAHRLSTVKNADKIIVLDKGKVVEMGNHQGLLRKKGIYFQLIKDQLELDK
jgi:ATP-binding cassette, subfamily B, bacterial